MIRALKFPGSFHRQQIAGIGDHADLAVAALRISANLAKRIGREVIAALALTHLGPSCEQSIRKLVDLLLRLIQQVQSKTLSRSWPNTRESLKLIDQSGQRSSEAAQ